MFSEEKIPACACTAHPEGEARRKYMFVAEETPTHVTWCCKRCSEICRFPVIQVRTLDDGWRRARYLNHEMNPQVDEQKARIIQQLRALKRRQA